MRLLTTVIVALVVNLAVLAACKALDQPVVYRSWSTKECKGVDDPAAKVERRPAYTCSNLPEQYDVTWVE